MWLSAQFVRVSLRVWFVALSTACSCVFTWHLLFVALSTACSLDSACRRIFGGAVGVNAVAAALTGLAILLITGVWLSACKFSVCCSAMVCCGLAGDWSGHPADHSWVHLNEVQPRSDSPCLPTVPFCNQAW